MQSLGMKPTSVLLLIALTSCSSSEPPGDEAYKADQAYLSCVAESRGHLGRPDETSATEAILAVNECERQLRISAYLQAKKRAGKGKYRDLSEVDVYRAWKEGSRNRALCELSTEIRRCLTPD